MLIDTCILFEIARKQEKALECADLLEAINQHAISEEAYVTKFALNAMEAVMGKYDKELLKKILLMIYQGSIRVYTPEIQDDLMTLNSLTDLGLDFDDTTQFMAVQKLGTYIVTLDKDFKKVPIQIKTPAEVLKTILI